MTRRRVSRRAEIAELRDRAVHDATKIARLTELVTATRAELDAARAQSIKATHERDQLEHTVQTLNTAALILVSALKELGVTCIHPTSDGHIRVCQPDSTIKTKDTRP